MVIFANRVTGTVVTHVYLPSPTNPGNVQVGNGPGDYPQGTTDWAGWQPVSGNGFSAQLFGAAGPSAPVDSLAPAFPITTFRTGADAGFVSSVIATLTDVPADILATIQMRVWDNQGGTVPTWAVALAQPPGTELMGTSNPIGVRVSGIGPIPPTLDGLLSFSLTYNVPEPPPFALLGTGALALWLSWASRKPSDFGSELWPRWRRQLLRK